MTCKFKKIVIIGTQSTQYAADTLQAIVEHLKNKKLKVFLDENSTHTLPNYKIPKLSRKKLKNYCDLIMVIGGDGSLLSAARIAARQNLPIVGINRGTLGFLTDISPHDITKIDDILAGRFHQEYRFLLQAKMENKNKLVAQNLALNDIVVLSYTSGHMIEFEVAVDEKFLCSYRADGLIIATPTGSTAHALSSGGPILHPNLENIVLVPILSHNLSSRPIVISSKSIIKISCNKSNVTDILVLCDGQTQTIIQEGTITIKKAKERLRLIHPKDYNYFETLRTKLNWEKEYNKT